jgi:ABC-2 type transport system ATP-binding protein
MNGNTVIEAQELTKVYKKQTAVNRLNLKIEEGEIFGFLGPNGAGKTTTILMLLGLTEPTSGKATVCGFDPTREALKIKRRVGYLPENVGFYDDMNAVQNLLYISRLNGIPDKQAIEKITQLLDLVDLKSETKKKVGDFSRGMRQRLGIAEVLLKNPQVAFLDEPTLGLDPEGSIQILNLIQSLSRDKKITVCFSSHYLEQVQKIATRIGIMLQGSIVALGRIEDLAKEKLGLQGDQYTLEELYLKYFKED